MTAFFTATFADGQLTDAIKHLVTDPGTDQHVKRKLISILIAWHKQFQNDPHMSLVANLYKTVPSSRPVPVNTGPPPESAYDKRKREEKEAKESKRKAKEEERLKREQELARAQRNKRTPFNFEKEKPQILQAIAETSQSANNLLNALTVRQLFSR